MKLKIFKRLKSFLSANPRLRVFVIFLVLLVILIIVVNNLTRPKAVDDLGNSYVKTPSGNMKEKTTEYTKKTYKKINDKLDKNKIKKAENQGRTAISESTKIILPVEPKKISKQEKRIVDITGSKIYEKMVSREKLEKGKISIEEQAKINEERRRMMAISARADAKRKQLKVMLASWNTTTPQGYVQGVEQKNSSGSGSSQGQTNKSTAIKAGTIFFAVLETQLNSDQPGTPVMATVVQGKFKDSKLLGSFKRENEKLVIKFNRMSIPGLDETITVNSYAINSMTAQNALASDVDNHYLTRYGGLFAAAFLQGFGQYFNDTSDSLCGSSATCIVTGDQTKQEDPQTVKKAYYAGLGSIGTALAGKATAEFDRPPTVTLNQGVGMGILFMADVKV